MRKRMISIVIFALIVCFCAGCGQNAQERNSALQSTAQSSQNVPKPEYIHHIFHGDVTFVSEEDREAWRTPLTKLLSNKATPYWEDGSFKGYHYLYPDQPCIENGYQLGLFDLDANGIPELLVNLGGGSAGNAFYYVYDILTGEELGSLNGGFDGSWCVYFDSRAGGYETVGQFEWRMGWNGKERFVKKATLSDTLSSGKKTVYETPWLFAYYEIDAVRMELSQEDIEAGIDQAWGEICNKVLFYVNGSQADMDEYFFEYDRFVSDYIRIPETALQLVDWDDVCEKDEEQSVRARKMADALLSCEQEFLRPEQTD